MYGFSYERLERITRTEKPYRGTTNRFPLGTRKQNLRNFYVREENGVKVFDIVYGTRWTSAPITKDDYDAIKAVGGKNVHHYEHDDSYIEYSTIPNRLGIVYPEGYFQFMQNAVYSQGDRAFLTDYSTGWFTNDSRRGGMVWTQGRGADYKVIPIFKEARFATGDTPHLLDEYSVIGRKVDRKVGKELLAGYEHFYKVSEAMCKALDREAFLRVAKEVIDENKGKYFEAAEALRDQAPLDAMILYAVALDVGKIQQQIHSPTWYQQEPHEIFNNLKRKMNNRIYREHPEVFKPAHYAKGEVYPPSIWGYEVQVDGEIREQY